ncbi:MAG: hypothetical protein OHK0029_41320 [Armatimonadaceae bacterium]
MEEINQVTPHGLAIYPMDKKISLQRKREEVAMSGKGDTLRRNPRSDYRAHLTRTNFPRKNRNYLILNRQGR